MKQHPRTTTGLRRKGLRSLSARLTLIFLLTGLLLVVLVVGAFRFSAEEYSQIRWRDMLVDYVATISQDISPPFTAEQARNLAQRTMTEVSIQSDDGHWVPSPPPFDMQDANWNDARDPELKIGRWRGYFALARKTDGGTILFYDRPVHGFNFLTPGTLISLALIILVIFACFHYVKALLRPIQTLTAAVEEVREGNLSVEVPVKRQDELGVLTTAFNSMSQQIKRMLDAKHQLLIALSHELRSPLTRLRMAAELLPESENQKGMINDCRIMDKIIADIMEGERLEGHHQALNYKEVVISDLIQEASLDFPSDQQDRIEVFPGPEITVIGDPVRLKLVLRNLLQNALDYSNEQPVTVKWTRTTDSVEIAVADQGPGFSADDLQHIGEPFYRADQSRTHHQGNGMGLYLCKLICIAHGGRLGVSNYLAEGTDTSPGAKVTVILPN
ncbi:sensor histidine kinase [Marinobacter sp.]|uniref:sensor histidine kinase n=1 Tax=Marinobacter sp. TaxID=50741 RepID=UPI003A8FDC0F